MKPTDIALSGGVGHWPLSMTGRVERLNHQMTDKIIHSMADAQWKGCMDISHLGISPGYFPGYEYLNVKQYSESAYIPPPGKSVPDPESVIRIRTPRPDDFQNLTGTSLSKYTSVLKFSRKSDQFFFGRYEPISCGKCPISIAMSKNLF